ncbi:hypothetical protein CFP56_036696 [Quercus suber]|uniref:Uncharacterized protein n=1 Tax=Quercus suber TaxID=58331 RepID=A0AAW0MCD4_QUESU
MGFMIRVHLQYPIPFSMMIPMPIFIHHQRRQKHVDPTLKRRLIHRIDAQVYIVFQDIEPVCLDDLCNIKPIVKDAANTWEVDTPIKTPNFLNFSLPFV